MRPGQHNNKRGRSRNRRHGGGGNGGGGGGQGGGNNANRVYDSNGPDVKLRGTAQTIAEKYMQLGRDAQSSGDIVMAESYYQFADHYYRVWLAVQPVGQPLQFSRRMAEEEFEDEGGDAAESEDEVTAEAAEGGDAGESGDETERTADAPNAESQGQPQGRNQQREPRDGNREGNRFRQRWPRRNDRAGGEPGQAVEANAEPRERPERAERAERTERNERPERPARAPQGDGAEDADNWEAPSFLRRPAPVPEATVAEAVEEPAVRPRRSRSEPAPAAPEDVPQDE